jgi:hypothetical protein
MGEQPFPPHRIAERASHGIERSTVVPPDAGPAHSGIDLHMERPLGPAGPCLERDGITDGRAKIELEAWLDPLRQQRRHQEQRPRDARSAEGGGFVHRRNAEPPRIERFEGSRDLHRAESVAVSFDHRQQSGAAHGGDGTGIRRQRRQVDVHPGA